MILCCFLFSFLSFLFFNTVLAFTVLISKPQSVIFRRSSSTRPVFSCLSFCPSSFSSSFSSFHLSDRQRSRLLRTPFPSHPSHPPRRKTKRADCWGPVLGQVLTTENPTDWVLADVRRSPHSHSLLFVCCSRPSSLSSRLRCQRPFFFLSPTALFRVLTGQRWAGRESRQHERTSRLKIKRRERTISCANAIECTPCSRLNFEDTPAPRHLGIQYSHALASTAFDSSSIAGASSCFFLFSTFYPTG